MARPVFVIVPGASSLPFFYDGLVKAVKAKGYDIEAVPLASASGAAPEDLPSPLPTMYDDAANVAKRIEELADAGKDVIVITHSYGGVPGTQATEGLTKKDRQSAGKQGGVIGLAYMTSLVPNLGEVGASVQAGMKDEDKPPALIDEAGWVYYKDIPRLAEVAFSGLPKEEREYWASKLVRHSTASFASPLTYAGFKDVPVSYLLAEQDLTIPADIQRKGIEMIERESGNKVDVTPVPCDHAPPFTAPEATVNWLVGVAEKLSSA